MKFDIKVNDIIRILDRNIKLDDDNCFVAGDIEYISKGFSEILSRKELIEKVKPGNDF